jgi:hypothetical protein
MRQTNKRRQTMTNEELYLRNKVGQGNPFKVPEGYFEQLTSQVMNQLPEKKAKVVPMRRWLYAAACVAAIAVLGLTFMFNNRQAVEQQSLTASVSAVERDYMDEAADYALIDNAEIYACLSEN